ncbi:rhodanese-like domain-containing protein [Celeribacter marinus]|uniref:Rhodanese-like domain protein n=1 Tax=Celeribacter marinus TaxID=1397108 RepID=A0A0N7HIA2_9RHOB|nr:rhodanese-like domain-containing protein [Celeribacter marinus]ALI54653.1 rhodanese-like domain protein [Celeribacter marinus]SFK52404.1 Rhodanese-related sulfurtransferase [Celeribacter marinus]
MFGLLKGKTRIAVSDVVSGLDAGTLVLVDVRDAGELRGSGKAKGAINVPMIDLQMKANPSSPECLPAFKQGKHIVVYCASGARSAGAKRMLGQFGHDHVDNLGGLYDWVQAGGELEQV